jgi:hypothetical protein
VKGTSALANLASRRGLLNAWQIAQKAPLMVVGWVAERSPTRESTMKLSVNLAKFSPELVLHVSTSAPTTQVVAARSASANALTISTAALAFYACPIISIALMFGTTLRNVSNRSSTLE